MFWCINHLCNTLDLTTNKSILLGGKCTQANSKHICLSFLSNLLIYVFTNKDMCRHYQQSCGPTAIHCFLIGWKRIHMWWWFLMIARWMEVLNCGSIVQFQKRYIEMHLLVLKVEETYKYNFYQNLCCKKSLKKNLWNRHWIFNTPRKLWTQVYIFKNVESILSILIK